MDHLVAQNVSILGGTLGAMAFLELGIKSLAKATGNHLREETTKRIEFISKPEILAVGGAVLMLVGFIVAGGHTEHLGHVFDNIDWHAAILVMAMMFQSLQLGRFVNRLMAGVQTATGSDERKFNFASIIIVGLVSSLLSEVAVAAAVTGTFAMVNRNQTFASKEKLVVLMAAAVGVGGGLTNFAAPSIVIGANKFDWTTFDTVLYLGPAVVVSLLACAVFAGWHSQNCADSVKVKTEPLRPVDWANLVAWAGILWFGVFAEPKSIAGMLVVTVLSFLVNAMFAISGEQVTDADSVAEDALDAEHSHNPVAHLVEQVWESSLVFGFLVGLMFMGDMCAPAIAAAGEYLPGSELARVTALFLSVDLFSGWADNALAVFQMAPLAQSTPEQVAICWGSLTGGCLTIVGNAPNIVILLLFSKQGVKVGFMRWIWVVLPAALVLKAVGTLYVLAMASVL